LRLLAGDRVQLAVRAEAGRAVLRVTDTGSGIAADEVPHAFDRLWRDGTRPGRPAPASAWLSSANWSPLTAVPSASIHPPAGE
jgi:hypothetical protein